ncbi:unnamed protein product [Leuciscus chuanchicus]
MGKRPLVDTQVALDESTDNTDTAQLTVHVRGVDDKFEVIKELLAVIPMHGQTTAQEIFRQLCGAIEDAGLSWKRFAGITTDRAPSMTGRKNGLVALVQRKLEEENVEEAIALHCIIHQQELNVLNRKLQGQGQLASAAYDNVRAFSTKLVLSKAQLSQTNLCHFPACKALMDVGTPFSGEKNADAIMKLQEEFDRSHVIGVKIVARMKYRAPFSTVLAECYTASGDHGMKAFSVIPFPNHNASGNPYARELNELTPDIKDKLPPTDSRFRPDQRLLEQGKVVEADKCKDEMEEKQRDRRKAMAKRGEEHVPRFFIKTLDHAGREVWVTNGTYWKIRENPGFASTGNLELW